MASIVIQFVEKTDNRNLNPPLTGRHVAAWPVSDFVQTPADGKYPTTQTPAATGTTDSGGNCTLTGLTGSALYYVSIVDAGTMPHWTQPLVAGSGVSNKLTYVPSPFTPLVTPASSGWGPLFRVFPFGTGTMNPAGGSLGWNNTPDFNVDSGNWTAPTYTVPRDGYYLVIIRALVTGPPTTDATLIQITSGYTNSGGGTATDQTLYDYYPTNSSSGLKNFTLSETFHCKAGDTFSPLSYGPSTFSTSGVNGEGGFNVLGPTP